MIKDAILSYMEVHCLSTTSTIFTESGPESPGLSRRGGMGVPFLGRGWFGSIGRIIPRQVGIQRPSKNLGLRQMFLLASFFQLPFLSLGDIHIDSFFAHQVSPLLTYMLKGCMILAYQKGKSKHRADLRVQTPRQQAAVSGH